MIQFRSEIDFEFSRENVTVFDNLSIGRFSDMRKSHGMDFAQFAPFFPSAAAEARALFGHTCGATAGFETSKNAFPARFLLRFCVIIIFFFVLSTFWALPFRVSESANFALFQMWENF